MCQLYIVILNKVISGTTSSSLPNMVIKITWWRGGLFKSRDSTNITLKVVVDKGMRNLHEIRKQC